MFKIENKDLITIEDLCNSLAEPAMSMYREYCMEESDFHVRIIYIKRKYNNIMLSTSIFLNLVNHESSAGFTNH